MEHPRFWKLLTIDDNFPDDIIQVCNLVVKNIERLSGGKLWVCEYDQALVQYQTFNNLRDMCEFVWTDWCSSDADTFKDVHRLHPNSLPMIECKYNRKVYIFTSRDFATEFLEVSYAFLGLHAEQKDDMELCDD